jgi:hypothetical protein
MNEMPTDQPAGWNYPEEYERSKVLSGKVDELATLVRMLVHAHRKAAPGNALCERAMDYLKRNDLAGSPLRDDSSAVVEKAWQQFCEGIGSAQEPPGEPSRKDAP